jgi:hypothetical protein
MVDINDSKVGWNVMKKWFSSDAETGVDEATKRMNEDKEALARASKEARELVLAEVDGVIPEIKAMFPVIDKDEEKDDVGHKVLFYTYKSPDGDVNTVNAYEYEIVLYKAQVKHFAELMEAPKQKIDNYRSVVKEIDKFIEQRIGEMNEKKDDRDRKIEASEIERENRRMALERGEFQPIDTQDKALKRKTSDLSGRSGSLPDFDSYVFDGDLVDIDDETKTRKHEPDLRKVQERYNKKADNLESEVYEPLEKMWKKSARALKQAEKNLKTFKEEWDD